MINKKRKPATKPTRRKRRPDGVLFLGAVRKVRGDDACVNWFWVRLTQAMLDQLKAMSKAAESVALCAYRVEAWCDDFHAEEDPPEDWRTAILLDGLKPETVEARSAQAVALGAEIADTPGWLDMTVSVTVDGNVFWSWSWAWDDTDGCGYETAEVPLDWLEEQFNRKLMETKGK